jgi:hypothetical protein
MLITKQLPKYLWVEAVSYATWLKNRLPSWAIPGTTSFELVRKTKPNLAQAHEFGTRVYVHLLNAGKLEARAEEAIFVSVDAESKGYRVYWMGKHQVLVERNITFAPMDIEDVLNEGESSAVYDRYNNNNNIVSTGTSSTIVNAPNIQVIPKVLTPPP